jgi:hypothetical protein
MNLVRKNKIPEVYTRTSSSFDPFDPFDSSKEKINEENKNKIWEKFSSFISKLKEKENFIIWDDILYSANSEFHITTLFTGSKPHDKSPDMESQLNKKVLVNISKLAVSHNFITLGVKSIKLEDGTDIAYYGNEVKHITIALNKTGKKVFPKDSYTALSDGKIYIIDSVVDGICSKVTQ